jgi:predicted membrane-bound spermidine synthase
MALALTVLTGFSGLVYEVAWEKYLATLLGSHSEATSAVLGIFLGGLSVGYSLFGRVTRRWVASGRGARLLVLYGIVEGSIGLYVLAFPWLFQGMLSVSAVVSTGATGFGFVIDVILSAILIGPPAVLMGGTIPILTQALARSAADATRFHALVYALNTAGAFAGALAAGFLLVPTLGLVRVMMAMGVINLTAGLSFGLLGLRRDSTPAAGAGEYAPRVEGFGHYAAAALLVGFAMMALQTVLIRIGGLSLGASQFTFSMVVATFVLCIALGSLGVSALSRIPRLALAVNQWLLVGVLFLLYALIPYAPYASHVLRTLFRSVDQAFYGYYFAVFLSILVFIGPAVVLSGATLPLLFDHLRRQVDDLGAIAGRLYSWNTLGSLLGALLGGYALLFWLDLHQVYHTAMAALIAAAAILGIRLGGRVKRASQGLLAVSLVAMMSLDDWDPRWFVHGPFRTRAPTELSYGGRDAFFEPKHERAQIVFYEDDPVSSVAVTEQKFLDGGLSRSIINNGKSDGNTLSDYTTMSMAAILPALLADRAEHGFVIGFGTGVSVGELIALPSMSRVVVSEISPAVMDAAPMFDFANQNVMKSPKVEVIRSDAYRALLGSDDRYDVIVSEPSNPWVQGVEMLFSTEFLTAARDRLRPGGVYAQWYHQYETDAAAVELVLRTYAQVFDRISVWYGLGPDLIILGFQKDAHPLDLERLRARAAGPAFKPGLDRSKIETVTELLGHELAPFGVIHAAALEGRVHTLYEPILGYAAARAFYRGEGAFLPFTGFGKPAQLGRRNSLLARHMKDAEAKDVFDALCGERQRECVALLARWHRARPDAATTSRFIRRASKKRRTFGGEVTLDLVASVSRLYRLPGETPSTEPVTLGAAKRATTQYARYYTHAVPFSPRALIEIWERCSEKPNDPDQKGACEQGLSLARQLLRHGTLIEAPKPTS